MKRVWQQLEEFQIRVEIQTAPLELRCSGDQLLMEVFIDRLVDQADLKWLNWCCVFLHVTTISDLMTADGRSITSSAWSGVRDSHFVDTYNWPRTVRPSERHWELWRAMLHTHVCASHSNRRLSLSLGPWTDSLDRWCWMHSRSLKLLLHRAGDRIEIYCPITARARTTYRRAQYKWWSQPLPVDCQRATVDTFSRTGYVTITGLGTSESSPLAPPSSSLLDTWREWAMDITPDHGWVPDCIFIDGSESAILSALQLGELRMVSDGTYKDPVCTAAVQLRTKQGGDVVWVRCRVPGVSSDLDSYRGELVGLLAGVLVVSWLRDQLDVDPSFCPLLRVACDGLEALRRTFSSWPLSPVDPQFDVLSSLWFAIRESLVQWKPQHVKGHMDSETPWHLLTWWEKRNVEVDLVAQEFADELLGSCPLPALNPKFFSEPCAVYVQEVKISSLSLDKINEAVILPELLEYWAGKPHRPSAESFSLIDWDAVHRSMKALPPGLQRWVSKHTVGMCGVNKFQKLWKRTTDNRCPICLSPGVIEDHLHVPRCPDGRSSLHWRLSLAEFHEWGPTSKAASSIIQFFSRLLNSIRNRLSPSVEPPFFLDRIDPSLFLHTCQSQLQIGAQGSLDGLVAVGWAQLQTQYFRSIGSRKSGNLWAAQLSQRLLLLGHQMWQHRNSIAHSDANAISMEASNALESCIREQFDMGGSDLPQHFLPQLHPRRLPEVLQYSLADKEDWLEVLVSARRLRRRAMAPQRHIMWQFLHSPPGPRNSLNYPP